MITLIISILSLILGLYVGFKRRTIEKTSKWFYLGDNRKDCRLINTLFRHGGLRGIDVVTKKTTSILGKERVEHYLELSFYGYKKDKIMKL